MHAARTIRLSVFCLTGLCGLGVARAEEAPESVEALLPAAHTEVQIGLGLMTSGLGVVAGHRFANGVRLEGGLGTMGLFTGGTLAAGGSLRVIDSGEDALEIPFLLAGTFILQPDLPYACGDEGEEEECRLEDDERLATIGSVLTGLDWVHGDPSAEGSNFVLSLRAGPAWNGDSFAVVPQLSAGWSF